MTGAKYATLLREIRDRIGREVQDASWNTWQQRMRDEVAQHPGLARMLTRAVRPAGRSRFTGKTP